MDSGFRVLDSRKWKLDSRSFWIPKPRVPDSTCKNFLDSGFHKQTSPRFSTCGEDYTKMQPDLRQAAVHQLTTPENTIAYHRVRGARVAQWWEHSPPTNVAPVQILVSTSYVGWVCCWFSSLLREVFRRVLQFSSLFKTNTFKFQFDLERTDTFQRVLMNSLMLRE